MRIGQNGPLEKFTRFLFMRLSIANIWHDNIYADTNLCDRRLTRIIRINKTCVEKCHFTVHQGIMYHEGIIISRMITPRACTRGKVIGCVVVVIVVVVVVVSTKIAIFQDVGI